MSLKNTRNRAAILVALMLFALMLGSCLDINTALTLKQDGEMSADITYTLDGRIADYGRGFGTDDPWPFPLTEKDFQQKALMIDGVQLKRYRSRTDRDGADTVRVVVEAESVEAMSDFLDIPMQLDSEGNSGSLVISLPEGGGYSDSSEDTRKVIDSLVGDSLVTFSIRTPSSPADAGAGIIDGRNAVLELRLEDVLYGNSPESWTVTW